ncbi:MAG: DUF1616 domain-containing protein [Nitrososphaerota archaeon]|jgi:hypothetical protein|nr:DUF1616 domain-containing protein [Nitrososphaerota archaeon]
MENSDNQIVALEFDKNSAKKIVAMLAALIVICSVVGVSVVMYAPRSEGYNVMYLLDIQNQTGNNNSGFSHSLVVEQSSTFHVQVVVENNKPLLYNYQVQVKIASDTFSFPVNVSAYEIYEFTLDTKQSWNYQVPVSLNEEGEYSVVFELFAEKDGVYRFTDLFCVKHVKVVVNTE